MDLTLNVSSPFDQQPNNSTTELHKNMYLTSSQSLDDMLEGIWDELLKVDCVSSAQLQGFDELLRLGGAQWFCEFIVQVQNCIVTF